MITCVVLFSFLLLQEETISSLHKEISYLKQELIEARAHKSASDDQLGNVSGKLETLENTISSLSDEGNYVFDLPVLGKFEFLGQEPWSSA